MELKDLIFSNYTDVVTTTTWGDPYKYIKEDFEVSDTETIPLVIGAAGLNDSEISEALYVVSNSLFTSSYDFQWYCWDNDNVGISVNSDGISFGTDNAGVNINRDDIYLYGNNLYFNNEPIDVNGGSSTSTCDVPNYLAAEDGAILTRIYKEGGEEITSDINYITEFVDYNQDDSPTISVEPNLTNTLSILCTWNTDKGISDESETFYPLGLMIDENSSVIWCSDGLADVYNWTDVKTAVNNGWYDPTNKYFKFVDDTNGFGYGSPSLDLLEPEELHDIPVKLNDGWYASYSSSYLYKCIGYHFDNENIILEFSEMERISADVDAIAWKKPENKSNLNFCVASIDSLKTYHEIYDGESSGEDYHSLFEVSETYNPREQLIETDMLTPDGYGFKYSVEELKNAKFSFHVNDVDNENKYFIATDCVPTNCYIARDKWDNYMRQILIFHIADYQRISEDEEILVEKSVVVSIRNMGIPE